MNILPSFSDLTYFIEAAQTKNLSRAAERLGITQPSLSLAIKRLEDSLGVPLFIRSRKGVELTKAGKDLVGRGRVLLLNWEQLRSEVTKKSTGVSGEYVIGCHASVALYSLPNFLPQLVQDHPDLELKLVHDLSRKITEKVISFEVDFGIVVNPVSHPDLVIKPLCKDDVSFWTSSKPTANQVLDMETGVLLCDLNLTQVKKLLSDLQKKKQGFKRIIQSCNLEVIAEMTAAGVGVGILPTRVATRDSVHGLKPLKGKLPIFKDDICLVYRADAQKNQGSKVLIEAIKNAF